MWTGCPHQPWLEWSGLHWSIQTKKREVIWLCFHLNILKTDITGTKLKFSPAK